MATKTATVTARVQPDVKAQAETILEQLGIPVSAFIDMAYRQVILKNGLPFRVDLSHSPVTMDCLSESEFHTMMAKGLEEAKADRSLPLKEAFDKIRAEI